MKKILILTFCICFVFSSSVLADYTDQRYFANQKHNRKNDFPNIFRPIGNLIKRIFGKKQTISVCYRAGVKNVILSQKEVVSICSNDSCYDKSQVIEVLTEPLPSPYPDEILTYKYEVSGGKIIGEGAKVAWDLSGVKAGKYTITASVDDGCGFCGRTMTEIITVLECPNCPIKDPFCDKLN